MCKPILKWVGGKTQILDKVLEKFPKVINNYREPFLGGGSVLLGLLDKVDKGDIQIHGKIYACDINDKLIAMYNNIKMHPEKVIETLNQLKHDLMSCGSGQINRNADSKEEAMENPESYYYYIRSMYNQMSNADKNLPSGSAIIIFLNKTCFRGVYREGPRGFNVPYGNYKNPSFDEDHIRTISRLIQPVEFNCSSFEISLEKLEDGDFVYLDPPYAPENSKSFVGYTRDGFLEKDHERLFGICKQMNVSWVMSNSNVPMIRNTFVDFTIESVVCRRAINSKKPNSTTNEVLISK